MQAWCGKITRVREPSSSGLVIVPAFNEQDSIESTLVELCRVRPDLDIVVIDDGSTDSTRTRAMSVGARVITVPFRLGVGGAMRIGFRYAVKKGYKYAVQVDADGQHDPSFISNLEQELEHSDVVVGARFSHTDDYSVANIRRWTMHLLAYVLSVFCKTKLSDATSGFRATGTAALTLFAEHYPSEYLGDTVESLLLAHRAGLVISEVPVHMRTRVHGTPSTSLVTATLYLLRTILALMVAIARPRRMPLHGGN